MTRILDWVERYRQGPLGAAFTTGAAFFGIVWTILEASGVSGSRNTILVLLLFSGIILAATYILLLQRRIARLVRAAPDHAANDVREALEKILTRLEPPTADQIRAGLRRYEETIEELRDQLRPLAFPLRPILVEGGVLTIGTAGFSKDEAPPHEVEVDSFLIDPCPVTNQQFAEFLADPENREWSPDVVYAKYGIPYFLCEFFEGRFPSDKWDHPAVWVNWHVAAAFCIWRSRMEGRQPVYEFREDGVRDDFNKNGWRLPTEVEWERAARDGLQPTMITPPLDPTAANYARHYRGTTSVGRFKANRLGVWDLFGNVKEWCHDWYDPSYYSNGPRQNPKGPDMQAEFKVFRGASWMESLPALRVTRRGKLPPANTNPDLGFRCVRRP